MTPAQKRIAQVTRDSLAVLESTLTFSSSIAPLHIGSRISLMLPEKESSWWLIRKVRRALGIKPKIRSHLFSVTDVLGGTSVKIKRPQRYV